LFRLRSADLTASIKMSRSETTATGSIGRFRTRRFLVAPIVCANQRQQSTAQAPVQSIALLHSGPLLIHCRKQNRAKPRPTGELPVREPGPATGKEELNRA
jgi:hypothetical protein